MNFLKYTISQNKSISEAFDTVFENDTFKNNKIIWIYWDSGWNNAPMVSQLCLQSWSNHNPDYLIVALDNTTLKEYIDLRDLNLQYLSSIDIVSLSDIIRIYLLYKYGGTWVDSTTLCLKNIDSLLEQYKDYGFFAYDKHAHYVKISSWFIHSEPNNLVIKEWMQKIIGYWKHRMAKHEYFWLHNLFSELLEESKEIKKIWNNMPKKSAMEKDLNGPHAFVPYIERLNGNLNKEHKNYIDNGYNNNYCLKLSRHWNTDWFLQQPNTTINYIFKKENLI